MELERQSMPMPLYITILIKKVSQWDRIWLLPVVMWVSIIIMELLGNKNIIKRNIIYIIYKCQKKKKEKKTKVCKCKYILHLHITHHASCMNFSRAQVHF